MVLVNPRGGTMAVYFDPSSPAVSTTISGTLAAVPTTGSGDPIYEETGNWTRVSIAGSQTAASLMISGQQSAGTNRPFIVNTDGALKVYDIVTGTIATVSAITNITNSIGVHIVGTSGTLLIYEKGEPTVIASGKQSTTTRPLIVNTDGAIKVYDIVTGTIATLSNITNSIAAHILSTGGTIMVSDKSEPTVISSGKQGTTTRPLIVNTDGAIKVYDIVTGTIATVSNITNSIAVHVLSTGGTLAVKIDPGYNVVNTHATIMIPQTASGSTSAVSVSGQTVVSPVTSRLIKVYAFSLTTTGVVNIGARFTNGAGTSPTEFWRVVLRAPSTGMAGANLAVTPPGYLFATASGSTLSLLLDTASLVHYSVAYFLESG